MALGFNVLRCYACEVFQVDQVKKSSKKWLCKICHEKQSIKQVFFNGTGKECRLWVQEKNMKRGNMQRNIRQQIIDIDQQHQDGFNEELSDDDIQDSQHDLGPVASSESKWNMFVTDENKDSNEDVELSADKFNITTDRTVYEENRKQMQGAKHKEKKNVLRYQPYSNNLNGSRDSYNRHTRTDIQLSDEPSPHSQKSDKRSSVKHHHDRESITDAAEGSQRIPQIDKDGAETNIGSQKHNEGSLLRYQSAYDDVSDKILFGKTSKKTKNNEISKGTSNPSKWDMFLPTASEFQEESD